MASRYMTGLIEEIQIYNNKPQVIDDFLTNNTSIDVNEIDTTGRTPLFYCVDTFDKKRQDYILESDSSKWPRFVRIAEILIKHGADIKKPVLTGWTVLHEAARHGDMPLIQLLMRHKMDSTTDTDVGGQLPAEVAGSHNHINCAILLDSYTLSLKRQCRYVLLKLGMGPKIAQLPIPIHLKLFLNYQNPFKGFKWVLTPQRPFYDTQIANKQIEANTVIEFVRSHANDEFVKRNADILNGKKDLNSVSKEVPQGANCLQNTSCEEPKVSDLIQLMNQMYTEGAFQCIDYTEPLPRPPRYSMDEI
ncbi:hypothetical protein LOD99_1156 [Oopsacas minuta]|uniref:Uncharacterized protein n=1 Tax=Oopsacas minuta TaxID=111878 RepID=A0AAV7K567_9METZ|nr:hypothetical protein LOD99_1156 [Oopsacas minuta]